MSKTQLEINKRRAGAHDNAANISAAAGHRNGAAVCVRIVHELIRRSISLKFMYLTESWEQQRQQ